MKMNCKTFGAVIRQARATKNLTQREVAIYCNIDSSYLSKLENDRAGYPPSSKVVVCLSKQLDIPEMELQRLAGRINPEIEEVWQELMFKYEEMPNFLRKMQDDPAFAQKVFSLKS